MLATAELIFVVSLLVAKQHRFLSSCMATSQKLVKLAPSAILIHLSSTVLE